MSKCYLKTMQFSNNDARKTYPGHASCSFSTPRCSCRRQHTCTRPCMMCHGGNNHPFMDVAGAMKRLFGFVEDMKPAFRLPARLRSTRLRMCFPRPRSEPVVKNKTSQQKSLSPSLSSSSSSPHGHLPYLLSTLRHNIAHLAIHRCHDRASSAQHTQKSISLWILDEASITLYTISPPPSTLHHIGCHRGKRAFPCHGLRPPALRLHTWNHPENL